MDKPFKGFIADWCVTAGRVFGRLVNETTGTLEDRIRTSEVVTIMTTNKITRVETKNSTYILI